MHGHKILAYVLFFIFSLQLVVAAMRCLKHKTPNIIWVFCFFFTNQEGWITAHKTKPRNQKVGAEYLATKLFLYFCNYKILFLL